MTKDQKLIVRVAEAGNALPNDMPYEEYVKQSPEHKAWAEAYNDLKEYADKLKEEA